MLKAVSGMLRQRGGQREQRQPAGMPEALPPAPKPWPLVPLLALLLCVAFLLLQLWPATHYRHPSDPTRTWIAKEAVQQKEEQQKEAVNETEVWHWEDEGQDFGTGLAQPDEHDGVSALDFLRSSRDRAMHVFLSTDEPDLRPLAVVINSTVVNARHPERIFFHLIIPPRQENWFKLKALFPGLNIQIFRRAVDFDRIRSLISWSKDSKSRQELTSPYNFVPFYLPQLFPDVDRLIYIDTDVVVQGDIEELAALDLQGHALAAVEDCMQHFKIYFNFELLEEIRTRDADKYPWLPKQPYDPTTCVFNRGVLVLDGRKWKLQNLTESIEFWMKEYAKLDRPLYSYGLSQPPFLLSVYRSYKKLDVTWNTRGLGRNEFSELEREYMKEMFSKKPKKSPFISPHADLAKILHYNGKFKPWKRPRFRQAADDVISICGHTECADIWWSYLSPTANDLLKSGR